MGCNNKNAVNVSVKLGGRVKTSDQLIRKFIRLCKKEGIVQEVKKRSFYLSKGEKRRKKKHASKKRRQSLNNKSLKR